MSVFCMVRMGEMCVGVGDGGRGVSCAGVDGWTNSSDGVKVEPINRRL